MRAIFRQFRRAPGRIIASILALTLAVGAIGVLAIPTVSEGTLHDAAERDGLADINIATTALDDEQLAEIRAIDGVAAAEGQVVGAIELTDGSMTRLVGLPFGDQQMDIVHTTAGGLPAGPGEIVTSSEIADVGESVVVDGVPYRVVGNGGTLWWSDSDPVLYADVDVVNDLMVARGYNRVVVTAADDSIQSLRRIFGEARDVIAAGGETVTEFPVYLPDGSTPIDEDIDQVSMLIGMLGIVAALVALVLLASTTNTLITERTREVAVMRALGGRPRPLRRRLRRISLGLTVVALVLGLPLGIVISNAIARMVLEEFVGITPDFAIDPIVLVASAAGMLLGARLVAARAARRVTKLPLAEALRDREGSPFGRRWTHRVAARIPTGGLSGRLALRASIHRPARTIAVIAQIAAAVGAAFLIPSLITSVNEFNTATAERWTWESLTTARDPGLPFDAAAVDRSAADEAGIWVDGELGDDDIDVYGLDADTSMFDPVLTDGRWFEPATREAVVSAGFAEHRDLSIGDMLTVELAGGEVRYRLTGTADDHGVAIYTDRLALASDLGAPARANVIWSDDAQPATSADVATRTSTAADLAADDEAARDAIVLIFGAIGLIVAGVAALAVVSSMTVSLYERRHELAAMQAIGARKRRLRGLLCRELIPIGLIGTVAGLGLGALGARAIIGSFESAEGIDIGVQLAFGTIPFILVAMLLSLVLLAAVVVRSAGRRPIAVTLRGAT